ncbi:prepilin-type N-terminal cleavage/methylation domain-containing protein [Beduini massiliensis]|uniref:prepilin-type N-terminal cleavage/methylation domain-containing protein n=1 Tax=Beduini massiliensis TaxID=1585974 RepID=UPI00356A15AC
MKRKLGHKGFTLVEIVVVLLIVSIVMALAGSIILSSFDLFGDSAQEDVSKRALDEISRYVNGELEYASDIRIAPTKPEGDNWWYLDIVDGTLVQNDDAGNVMKEYKVFSSAFYYGNQLEMRLSDFVNSDQFDIQYSFIKNEKEEYKVQNTLRFSNLTLRSEKESDYLPFDGLNVSYALSSQNVRIYYIRKAVQTVVDEKPLKATGTVADQIAFLNNYNNTQLWIENFLYRRGDMVFYNGYWWYCMVEYSSTTQPPDQQNSTWKKIDAYFDTKSGYQRGDIIIFEENYYRCKVDIIQTGYNPIPTDPNSGHWELLKDTADKTIEEILKGTVYTNSYQIKVQTVRNELDGATNIKEYQKGQSYQKEEIVKIYANGYDGDDDLADYYICISGSTKEDPQNSDKYEWKHLQIRFDDLSGYEKEDVVYYYSGGAFYIKAQQKIKDKTDPKNDIYNAQQYWKSVGN